MGGACAHVCTLRAYTLRTVAEVCVQKYGLFPGASWLKEGQSEILTVLSDVASQIGICQ